MDRPYRRADRCGPGKTNATKSVLLVGSVHSLKVEVDSIASKHAALHAMIDEEEHRPHPNEDLLHQLKKEKLKLKDALAGHYEL